MEKRETERKTKKGGAWSVCVCEELETELATYARLVSNRSNSKGIV